MKMPICARCKKNIAVVFITKIEDGKSTNEGLCLKCAKELGIKPIGDIMAKFGISEEDVDRLSEEMSANSGMLEEMMGLQAGAQDADKDEDDEDQPSRAPTMPFFNMLRQNGGAEDKGAAEQDDQPKKKSKKKKSLRNRKNIKIIFWRVLIV